MLIYLTRIMQQPMIILIKITRIYSYPIYDFRSLTEISKHHENIPIYDPLKPFFYIVKLGFTGVYISFLISAQNIDCGYSLEPPQRGGSNGYPQSMF